MRGEGVAVARPAAVHEGPLAIGTKDEVGSEADQAVPPARRAALHRFEQEIAATRLDQLQRGGDRGLRVGNLTRPGERRAAGGKRRQQRRPVAALSSRRHRSRRSGRP